MSITVTTKQLPSGIHILRYTDDEAEEWYYLQGPKGGWAYAISPAEYYALEKLCVEPDGDTEDDEILLRPCPFCGCKNVVSETYTDRIGKKKFVIRCKRCNGSVVSNSTPYRAVGGWNRRAVPIDVMEPGQSVVNMTDMINMTEEEQ